MPTMQLITTLEASWPSNSPWLQGVGCRFRVFGGSHGQLPEHPDRPGNPPMADPRPKTTGTSSFERVGSLSFVCSCVQLGRALPKSWSAPVPVASSRILGVLVSVSLFHRRCEGICFPGGIRGSRSANVFAGWSRFSRPFRDRAGVLSHPL